MSVVERVTINLPYRDPHAFGELLRAVREQLGISQREVARRATEAGHGRLSAAYLSRIETGDRVLGMQGALGLSSALPISFHVVDGALTFEIPVEYVG